MEWKYKVAEKRYILVKSWYPYVPLLLLAASTASFRSRLVTGTDWELAGERLGLSSKPSASGEGGLNYMETGSCDLVASGHWDWPACDNRQTSGQAPFLPFTSFI